MAVKSAASPLRGLRPSNAGPLYFKSAENPSTLRGIGVIPVGVALSDLAVPPVNEHFTAIADRGLASGLDSGALRRVDRRRPAVSLAPHRPPL